MIPYVSICIISYHIIHIIPPPHPEKLLRSIETGRRKTIPKLLKINTPTLIHIKHPNHHLHRMPIKTRKIPIHQRFSQFPFRQLPRVAFIHGFEKWEKGGVGAVFPTTTSAIVVVVGGTWSGCSGGAGGRRRAAVVGLGGGTEAVVLGRGGGGGKGGGLGG